MNRSGVVKGVSALADYARTQGVIQEIRISIKGYVKVYSNLKAFKYVSRKIRQ